ncbi:hypothetical protein LXL04_022852 [Taraxacum kok-saghyz]
MDLNANWFFLMTTKIKRRKISSSSLTGKRRKRRRKNTNLETMLILRESNRGQRQELGLEEGRKKKFGLRTSNMIQDTERGFVTTPNQRSEIEETLVDLESYGVGNEAIDLEKMDGTWRLQYTSESDVLVLLDSSSRLPFLQVFCFFGDPYLFPLV